MAIGSLFYEQRNGELRPNGFYVKVSDDQVRYVDRYGYIDTYRYSFRDFRGRQTVWRSGWDGPEYSRQDRDDVIPIRWDGDVDPTLQWR